MLGRLQFWLQGHPNKHRPWAAIWVGNQISSARYWTWRLTHGAWRDDRPRRDEPWGTCFVSDNTTPVHFTASTDRENQ